MGESFKSRQGLGWMKICRNEVQQAVWRITSLLHDQACKAACTVVGGQLQLQVARRSEGFQRQQA